MRQSNKNIVIIPARGGSKGLPRKNVLSFCGKPLIAWTIEQALATRAVDRVIVSTDCEEIATVALTFGAEVPGLRPAELSTDTSSTEDVLLYVAKQIAEQETEPKNIILLQCTSPIRFPGTIDKALSEFEAKKADSLVSVTKTHRFFWYNKQEPEANYDYTNRPRRQDFPEKNIPYMETGSIYITDFRSLLEHRNRLAGSICMFETDHNESFEIDDLNDFELCEYLAKKVMLNAN